MGRPRSVEVEGLRLEYHLARKCLRLVGPDDSIEIPIESLHELDVDMASGQRWLVFGGRRFRGGSKDLVGVFRSESDATAAFHELRERLGSDGWGEVLILEANGKRRQRLWFDTERHEAACSGVSATPRPRWARRRD